MSLFLFLLVSGVALPGLFCLPFWDPIYDFIVAFSSYSGTCIKADVEGIDVRAQS